MLMRRVERMLLPLVSIPKSVQKLYLRMVVMIILAGVTGSLVLLGNFWGAGTALLGSMYQMCNSFIFAQGESNEKPDGLSHDFLKVVVSMPVIVIFAFGTGWLLLSSIPYLAIITALIGTYLTVQMAIFVRRLRD